LQVPLEITGHDANVSKRIETLIRKKTDKLERFYDRLTSCRVVIDRSAKSQKQGTPFKVRIHLGVPGHEITIDRQQDPDLTAAVHAAFDAATRKLQEYARTRRGEVKNHRVGVEPV
jgi:ribosomal subunit interface protein